MFNRGNSNLMIPLAIVIAGAIVAGAIFINSRGGDDGGSMAGGNEDGHGGDTQEINLKPVSEDDHILGNPDADIVIVEFSDLECPFCKNFHDTMNQIISEYGKDGQVAWVYRHFPLTTLHPKAQREAEATECAAELGGNQGFWDYTNRIFEITPSNNGLDLDLLPEVAEEVGLDRVAFEECLESGRHRETVQAQFDDARAAGGTGTPYNIFVVGDDKIPLNGSVPLDQMRGIIEQTLLTL